MSNLKPYKNYQPVQYDYANELPNDWQLLPNIAIFQQRIEKNSVNLKPLSISAIKGIIWASDNERTKDRTSVDKSEYLIVHKGDIPYNTMLMWAGAIGYSAYKGIVSPAYTVLKPKQNVVYNPKYFHYLFRTELYKNNAKRFSYGIVDSRLRLYYTHFKRMYSIVPPLETQNAIANYLNKKTKQIDEFISKKERLIVLLEEEKKIFISDRFDSGNYLKTPLKYLISKIGCGVTPLGGANTYVNEGINFLRSQNVHFDGLHLDDVALISEKVHTKMKGSQVRKNDVLLNITGASIGRCCVYNLDDEANVNQHVCILRPSSKIQSDFLAFYLSTNTIQNVIFNSQDGASREGLPLGTIKKFQIPNIGKELQRQLIIQIKEKSEELQCIINKAKSEIEKIKEYQESLITNIVTGKTKVVCDRDVTERNRKVKNKPN